MPMKQLQHMQHVQHPLIYFCNIYMVQLQHTSKISETIETYNCNIGGRERAWRGERHGRWIYGH
jgi:hypothetical protein